MSRLLLRFIAAPALIILAFAYLPEIFPDHGVLYEAILKWDLERLRAVLNRGTDPNIRYTFQSGLLWKGPRKRSNIGWSKNPLLLEALNSNRADMATLLLKYGADPNVADKYGNTALWHAAPLGDAVLVKLLLVKGRIRWSSCQAMARPRWRRLPGCRPKFLLPTGTIPSSKSSSRKSSHDRSAERPIQRSSVFCRTLQPSEGPQADKRFPTSTPASKPPTIPALSQINPVRTRCSLMSS